MNALDLALANAAANAPKGEELHLENLDSIADPTIDEPQSIAHHTLKAADEIMSGWNELHSPKSRIQEQPHLIAYNSPEQDGLLLAAIKQVSKQVEELTPHVKAVYQLDIVLTDLLHKVNNITTTINTAAQSMPQEPDLKHRSLEEWPLTTLINELVERENGFMPFWYELRKRIPHELQQYVGDAMKGKYQSLEVLSELCAAMSYAQQPKPTITEPLHEEQYYPVEKQPFANGMVDPYPKAVPPQGKVTYPFNPYTS